MIQDLNIFKINNFQNHKSILLDLISKIPQTHIKQKGINVEHTDWDITPNMKREYVEYFLDNIFTDYAKEICKKFHCNNLSLTNIWFQVYGKNQYHSHHRHENAHFANVVFLKLPNKNLTTKIYNLKNELIDIEVEEGSILTFPAYLKHESSVNESVEKKIILSYNINIED